MATWIVWIVVACLFGLGEVLTMGLYLAPFALGALVAGLVAATGAGLVASIAGFVLGSVVALALIRPFAIRHRRHPPSLRSGAGALVGRQAVVVERIANAEGLGSIKIAGEVWTARAYDEDHTFAVGARVEVVEIRGATAVVMR